MKIFAFPFAGGNKYSFDSLKKGLPKHLSFDVIEYSGRGTRVRESLFSDLSFLVDQAVDFLEEKIKDTRFVFYGHSMGGIVAFLTAHKLMALHRNLPTRLLVSGCAAPRVFKRENISDLESEPFWEKIHSYGGLQDEILAEEVLKTFLEPIIRADFKCVERFIYPEGSPLLPFPIDVLFGSEEELSRDEAEAWQQETTHAISVTELSGNHFFIFEHKDYFLDYFQCL